MDNYELLFPNVVTFTCDPPSPPSLCHVYISSNTNMYVRAPFNVITQSTHLRSRIVWIRSVLYTIHLSQLAMSEGYLSLALNPGSPSQILSPSFGEKSDFSPKLWDKIRNGESGFEANLSLPWSLSTPHIYTQVLHGATLGQCALFVQLTVEYVTWGVAPCELPSVWDATSWAHCSLPSSQESHVP